MTKKLESFILTTGSVSELYLNMKLTFFQSDKSNWGNLQVTLSDVIRDFLACGKDFEIEFSKVKASKTYDQLKAIHRLSQLLAARLTEVNGLKYSMENAKDWIKWEFGFTQPVSEEKAIAEAINERMKSKDLGEKMTRKQFYNLVETFKQTLKEPRSFETATKEEMIELISKLEELGNKMGWNELKLTSDEMRALVKFYEEK